MDRNNCNGSGVSQLTTDFWTSSYLSIEIFADALSGRFGADYRCLLFVIQMTQYVVKKDAYLENVNTAGYWKRLKGIDFAPVTSPSKGGGARSGNAPSIK